MLDTQATNPVGRPLREQALDLIRRGVRVVEISSTLGVSKDAIWWWASLAGLTPRRGGSKRVYVENQALRLLRQGKTRREVAEELGQGLGRVAHWARKARILLRRGKPAGATRHPRRSEAEALILAGLRNCEIARRCEVSEASVRDWRRALGVSPVPLVKKTPPA